MPVPYNMQEMCLGSCWAINHRQHLNRQGGRPRRDGWMDVHWGHSPRGKHKQVRRKLEREEEIGFED